MKDPSFPFRRFYKNPILTRHDVPYPCNTVFNAAACKHGNEYIIVMRIEGKNGRSHLTLARSNDGYHFTVDKTPWVMPSTDPYFEVYERYGIEDPRITKIDDRYYIAYTAFGPYGPRVAIGYTTDFTNFERVGFATETDNKDAALFPEKFDDEYIMLNRPSGGGIRKGSIWIVYSRDLIYWGKSRAILYPEPGWANVKLGIGTPPVKTDEGWLCLYHGVKLTAAGQLYRVGVLLLDLKTPEKVIGYSPYFIFGPEELYEQLGDVPNVVFPCGIIVEDDGSAKVYYGAADTCIALAEVNLADLVKVCK